MPEEGVIGKIAQDFVGAVGDMGDGGIAVQRGACAHSANSLAKTAADSGTISIAWQGHCSTQTEQPVAERKVHRVAVRRTELDDRGLGTGGEAIVTFEAIAAGQTPFGLVQRFLPAQPCRHLGEAFALGRRRLDFMRRKGVTINRQMQIREANAGGAWAAAQVPGRGASRRYGVPPSCRDRSRW